MVKGCIKATIEVYGDVTPVVEKDKLGIKFGTMYNRKVILFERKAFYKLLKEFEKKGELKIAIDSPEEIDKTFP